MPVQVAAPAPRIPGVEDGLLLVEAEIRRWVTSSQVGFLNQETRQLFAAGGKRLRSALTLAMTVALGGSIGDEAVTAATSVEIVHAGSLVHDDLMDNASERRGVRTVNAEWDAGPAVMVGDFLLARAGQAALSVSPAVADELARTFVELAEGQTLEMLDAFNLDRSTENALRSVSLKTGALFRAGCVMGALCAGATPGELERASRYGQRFGEAFQILDDLLDLASTTELLGKPVGNDVRQGVYTLPLLRALDDDRLAPVRQTLAERRDRLSDEELEGILTALQRSSFIEDTVAYARRFSEEAAAALALPAAGEALAALRDFPVAYVEWARSLIRRR
ncbi:MAG TPA: polyprenyl synthetase family protein [Actinomycetota bacterium]|jgi:heptaprenyl diphosphate synthase/octaprenyl-diphosphate synthase|nr:polyprenyl synthetase family protein [Actinomycetota bacterium]